VSDLTPKQEAFCLAYLEEGNSTAAYRKAYDCENMSTGAIYVEAHRVYTNPKVTLRLEQLKAPAIEAARCTFEGHLRKLAELRDLAIQAEQYSPAIKAEENRGKVVGLYTDKVDLTSSDGSMKPTEIVFVGLDDEDE
jgi:phage terminase small subunit